MNCCESAFANKENTFELNKQHVFAAVCFSVGPVCGGMRQKLFYKCLMFFIGVYVFIWWHDVVLMTWLWGEKTTLAAFIGVGPLLPSSILPYNCIIHSSVESNFLLIGDAAVTISRPESISSLHVTSVCSVLCLFDLIVFFCFIYPLQQQYKVVNLDLGAWSSRSNPHVSIINRIKNVAFFYTY